MARERPGQREQPSLSPHKISVRSQSVSEEATLKSPELLLPTVNNEVCTYSLFELQNLVKKFEAGQVANYYSEWEKLTSDPEILTTVSGDSITFVTTPPENYISAKCNVSHKTRLLMDDEI